MKRSSNMLIASVTSPISLMLIFLISADLSILLDIPVFRQILGFIFLAFVPGALILCILRLDTLGLTEKFVLSVGISTSFVIFAGLLVNTVYPLIGYDTPLSVISLVISLTVAILILTLIALMYGQISFLVKRADLKLNIKEKALLLIPLLFPILSILGIYLMNIIDNNVVLMALLFLIPCYAILISKWHNQIPNRVYPPLIFLTSISLVFLLGLRSNHIIGADINTEYYLFQQTASMGRWQILMNSTLDSCLSITVLPTIYKSFLNINSEYIFKILYPFFFSISPLLVFLASRKYIGYYYAFLATAFFMSQVYFLNAAFSPRTVLAILFFALSIITLFLDGIGKPTKKLLFIVFIASCIISHYSTSYIFFAVLLFTWIAMEAILWILRKREPVIFFENPNLKVESSNSFQSGQDLVTGFSFLELDPTRSFQSRLDKVITSAGIALFFIILFFWYSQVTGEAFNVGINYFATTFGKMNDFFVLESRGEQASAIFGSDLGSMGILQKIYFFFTWLTIVFIAIGVLRTLAQYRHMVAFSDKTARETLSFLSQRIDVEFLALSLACSAFLTVSVILPYVSVGYGMDRAYCQMMIVLSPFFVIGGITVARFFRSFRYSLVILIVLIPYFLLTSGAMYQIFGFPQAIILNSEGEQYDLYYIHDQESYSANWLSRAELDLRNLFVHTDKGGFSRLCSQGLIAPNLINRWGLTEHKMIYGYIYLRYVLINNSYKAEYYNTFLKKSKIYDNGGSEIWL